MEVNLMDTNLKLTNFTGISVNGPTISLEVLERDAALWKGKAVFPAVGKDNLNQSDINIFRQLCFSLMPFTLTAKRETRLIVELVRFPYSIDDERAFQAFACRLMPEAVSLSQLKMHDNHGLTIPTLTLTPDLLAMNVGSGSLYLEVYLSPQIAKDLPPLIPPIGFKEFRYINYDKIMD
jgi:hypothetical protein